MEVVDIYGKAVEAEELEEAEKLVDEQGKPIVDAQGNQIVVRPKDREEARLERKYSTPALKPLRQKYSNEQLVAYYKTLEAKEQKKFAEIVARYPDLNLNVESDKSSIRALIEVEENLSYCQKCSGETCAKKSNKYWEPVAQMIEGEVNISWCVCKVERRRRAESKLPVEFRGKVFSDFDVSGALHDTQSDAQYAAGAWELAKQAVQDGVTNLYLYGTFGSGKTLLASLIAKECMVKGKSVEFGTVAKLLGELKETFDNPNRNPEDVLKRLRKCDVLILDDVGAERATEWKMEQLFELINERYANHKQLVITSNFSPEELHEELKKVNRIKAGQIMSRIKSISEFGYTGETDVRFKLKKTV